MIDPHGYGRLVRSLDFLVLEVRAAGVDPIGLVLARGFYGGSPTEFLGESLIALEALLSSSEMFAPSVVAFADALAQEIRLGFERIGGG